jgi:hypothetical protein
MSQETNRDLSSLDIEIQPLDRSKQVGLQFKPSPLAAVLTSASNRN